MKENIYDDEIFFEKYSNLERSIFGLGRAGEWPAMKRLLPPLDGMRILDIGCGFGWHARYMMENGAASITATDISKRMLSQAKEKNGIEGILYQNTAMEDLSFAPESFDMVFSSLALHYTESYEALVKKIRSWLKKNGIFLFSTEHPVFTSRGDEDWIHNADGSILGFCVDGYFHPGPRNATFLKESVIKYHRTLSAYVNTLIDCGFVIEKLIEPQPEENMINDPIFKDEFRRPQMLIIRSRKA